MSHNVFRTFSVQRSQKLAYNIQTVSSRAKLKARREPYWHRAAKGCYLGYRKSGSDSEGTWLVRILDEASGKQSYKSIGTFEELPPSERFDAAYKAASDWMNHVSRGGITKPKTVQDACDHYVEHITTLKGEKAASDVRMRFQGYVLNNEKFASCELAKLTPAMIQDWRKRLTQMPVVKGQRGRTRKDGPADVSNPAKLRSASTLNRDMTPFRAALNLAYKEGWVTTDFAWRNKLTPLKGAEKPRELYLDRNQRLTLIEAAAPDVAVFLRAMAMLPIRPGALSDLKVGDFDERLNELRVTLDKTGARKIKLPKDTAAFVKKASKGKSPSEPIFSRADGCAWNKDSWKGPIKEAVTTANLPSGTTAYTMRHSVITDLVHGGLDLLTVAQISGTSVRMIEKHYGHLRSEVAMDALARLTV